MIAPMKKVYLVLSEKEREEGLLALRKLGLVHVETVLPTGPEFASLAAKRDEVARALNIIPQVKQPGEGSLSVERGLIKDRLAMTGELSLTGQVLPIGGLREKTVAAKRNKIRDIIIPAANEKDLDDIPDQVKKGITFHPVERMDDVISIALGD